MNFQNGDIVTVSSLSGKPFLWKHKAIYIERDGGQFLHNKEIGNVQITDRNEFLKSREKIYRITHTGKSEREVLEYYYQNKGQIYNPLTFNCEHFANGIKNGVQYSESVIIYAVIVAIAIALYLYLTAKNR